MSLRAIFHLYLLEHHRAAIFSFVIQWGRNLPLCDLILYLMGVNNAGLISGTYFVYIMTNAANTVLYVGVTSDLSGRCYKHIHKQYENSFTTRYNINKLVYYERFETVEAAITREKQLKAGSRSKKINLIATLNPNWLDLYEREIINW